jgi:hypothetical protein
MMSFLLSSLLWLVWLAGVYVALSLGVMLLKKNWSAGFPSWKMTFAPFRFNWASTRKGLERTGLISVAFIAGYFTREIHQFNNTYVLHDVQVLRRDKPDMYSMRIGALQFEVKFCPDLLPDLDEGSLLKVLVYEERGTCKSVHDKRLGFIVARDDHGQPIKYREE